jgi:signal transduction histidine kinase
MLYEFLSANRDELISRCRDKVALRSSSPNRTKELEYGITPFLDQLIKTLQMERTSDPMLSREVSGASGGENSALSEMGRVATQHGHELHRHGFTVDQVVHDYGDLCQAITDLAFERDRPIEVDEYRTLNRCLDNAIAGAVSEFNFQVNASANEQQALALNERLGFFAHELRNQIHTATLALSLIRSGRVALNGATGDLLDRSMLGLTNLIDRSLAEVRMGAELPAQRRIFSLAEFIGEVNISASLEAQVRKCTLVVVPVDKELAVEADRDLLFSAVGNLLQNAFKFTHHGTQVTLKAHALADRILLDIQDQGPGLPPEEAEQMFKPFAQGNEDRTGLGLGLSIARRSVEANAGRLSVRNEPGSGCVFTIDLPRYSLLQPTTTAG